jgi:3-phenylpropionate/trans-cinnamate dioxygenase ferredoxin reductase subunit
MEGRITLIGDEAHLPYDRPPLSKQVLAGAWRPEQTALVPSTGTIDDLDLDWRLGVPASGLDLRAREVCLAGGERVPYEGLVIATGASARRLPGTDHLRGVQTLRTLDDAIALRDALEGAGRVVVVGFGFIGAEVAATCRERGLDVSVVEALPVPLERGLGSELGQAVADLHRDHGVDVRLGVGVVGIDGDARDQVTRVRLTDGTDIETGTVVVGIGVAPNTSWLEGSGLSIDNGVVCDATGLAAPGVVAAGDVARWPSARFGETMRVEHWENAVTMGPHAARRLLSGDGPAEVWDPVPWFWSDQYDRKIQLAGRAAAGDRVEVVAGSVQDRRFAALYGRDGAVVGVFGMSMPGNVMRWRPLVEARAPFEEALAEVKS